MRVPPRQMLRSFYDQSLLIPELLCLSCARSAWNRPGYRCSESKRHDCLLFASDMANQLGGGRGETTLVRPGSRYPVGQRP